MVGSPPTHAHPSPRYGRGRSERRLGVALSNFPRESYHLQTKIGRYIVPGQPTDNDSAGNPISPYQGRDAPEHGQPFGVVHDYTYDAIMRQHADSLQRLGVSSVDSLVIHDLDMGCELPSAPLSPCPAADLRCVSSA